MKKAVQYIAGQEENVHPIVIERAAPADAKSIMTLKRDAWLGAYVSEENGITEAFLN